MKHTAGPWVVDDGDGTQLGVFRKADGREIAYLAEPRNLASEEATANARLIASAPDLLAALRSIVRLLEAIGPGTVNSSHYASARAVIAKAEGK